MTTEAERLLRAAHAWENSLTQLGPDMVSPQMLRDAAAEIERLKAEVQAKSDVLAGSLKAQGQKDALLRDIGEWMDCGQGSSSEELMLHLRERKQLRAAIKQHLGEQT